MGHFQVTTSEVKCEAIDIIIIIIIIIIISSSYYYYYHHYYYSCYSPANKTHLHKKGFAPNLALKVRVFLTRK